MSDASISGRDHSAGIKVVNFYGWAVWLILIEYLVFASIPYLVSPSDGAAWLCVGAFIAALIITLIPYVRWIPFTFGSLLFAGLAYQLFCKFIRIGNVYDIGDSTLLYSTHPAAYGVALAAFGFGIWLHSLVVHALKEEVGAIRCEMEAERISELPAPKQDPQDDVL